MLNPKCQGCGAFLQTDDSQKRGYTTNLEHKYCRDCFQLKHYGIVHKHYDADIELNIKEHALILMISNVLHMDRLFTFPVHRMYEHAKFVYIVNQIDLLPKDTNTETLVENIKQKAVDLHIPFEDIILMSSKNKYDLEHLKTYIESYEVKDVYLLGIQNSGKTTIFKSLTHNDTALNFNKAGLTLDVLKGTFSNKTIYDMPGLFQSGYLHTFLPYEVYNRMIPNKTIRPKVYQMREKSSVLINNIVGVSILGNKGTFVCYTSDLVSIEKTNVKRINERIKDKTNPFHAFVNEFEERTFKIDGSKKMQLTIADMGFIHISDKMTLKVIYPKTMHISLMEALFK